MGAAAAMGAPSDSILVSCSTPTTSVKRKVTSTPAVRRLAQARQRGPRGHGPSSGPAAHARQSISSVQCAQCNESWKVHRPLMAWPGDMRVSQPKQASCGTRPPAIRLGHVAGRSERPSSAKRRAPRAPKLQQPFWPNSLRKRRTSAYSQKIEIFHLWNRAAPFASADANCRADHNGVLRSRLLQRVVALLQVEVSSVAAGGNRVSATVPPCGSMASL